MKHLPLVLLLACGADSSDPDTHTTSPSTGATSVDGALEDFVGIDRMMGHLQALQDIADAHAGTRAVGTSGFDASVDYAVSVFEQAGYAVVVEPFQFEGWDAGDPATAEVPGDPALNFDAGTEIAAMTFGGAGDVTAPLVAVDLVLPPSPNPSSTSGCEASDFAGFPAGSVALLQRGTCLFQDKIDNAVAAGASAALVFNEGQQGRRELEAWQLDPGEDVAIPVVAASFSVGEALAAALDLGPVSLHVITSGAVVQTTANNVYVETEGDPDHVLVVGGHLDSVPAGPGINDNGSGVALILELATQVQNQGIAPRNRIRFALWGGEEVGLLGSNAHVAGLSAGELDRILANLNFDMVGSPNGSRMVYDGDGDALGLPGPSGSDEIEHVFEDWFSEVGLASASTLFDGRSDYFAFIQNGIPAGGLFSGAEGLKEASEAQLFGGEAGLARDPCYHQACDTIDNIDEVLYEELGLAAAHATWNLASRGTSWANARRSASGAPLEIPVGACGGHEPPTTR